MALWLTRAGRHGEYEEKFFSENRIYATWEGLDYDLGKLESKKELRKLLSKVYPNSPHGRLSNHTGQLWAFAHVMKPGDWVVVPYRGKPATNVAEITGAYVFDSDAEDPYYHFHEVKWLERDIPRSNFDQDLLYSFGAIMTICRIERNDAENRVRAMRQSGWKSIGQKLKLPSTGEEIEESEQTDGPVDLEQLARDHISKLIMAKYKGHGLERLVNAILQAQGYTTYRSPKGPDKGVDILAAPGPLGFGQPRICCQVKSGESPVELGMLNQLIGAMQNVQADQGLFVSWGGFKSSIDKEIPAQFFRVRLWDQDSLIDNILEHYDNLDEDIRAELPLKRIWTVAQIDEDE